MSLDTHLGRLPNLLIAGMPKAGTSSLFRYLGQHPEICPAKVKEIRYFKPLQHDNGVLGSLDSYRQYFAHCGRERYAMEATPSYSYGGKTMLLAIMNVLERPRVIISLRNPVDRLWSAYSFQRTRGNIAVIGSFEEYVAECERKRKINDTFPYFRGTEIGFYGNYLKNWVDMFDDDLRVIFTDDLFAYPQASIEELCRWLSIDDAVASSFDFGVRNKTTHARSVSVSRSARAVKGVTEGLLRRAPALKEGLRRTYTSLNTGKLEEKLEPGMRKELEVLYASSNREVARMLKEKGYEQLPAWLEGTAVQQS